MLIPANILNTLTQSRSDQLASGAQNWEMYIITKNITKASNKGKFNTQLPFLVTAESAASLVNSGYNVINNQWGTAIYW